MPRSSLRMSSTRSSALRCPSWRRKASTMKSRLLERLPPAGRTRSTSMECMRSEPGTLLVAVAVVAAALFGRERGAAAVRGRRIRVLDREAAAGNGVDEVDFSALQVPDADRIDVQLDAVRFEHLIPVAAVFLDHETVLEAGAAAALDEDAQAAVDLLFFGEKL